jgi:hypothetical protein
VFYWKDVFQVLYKDILLNVNKNRVIAFEESTDVILRSGFINLIRNCLEEGYLKYTRDGTPASEVHHHTIKSFQKEWRNIKSTSTCLCCLRRRPQYGLSCGHIICENCVVVFGDTSEDDPWMFRIPECFLCGEKALEDVSIKIHPPTVGVGVICLDGGGTRGVMSLKLMKRIHDRIALPIPFQNFFKVAFGISSGKPFSLCDILS